MPQPEAPSEPVTVLGAGIVGICCALSLAERGVAVTLIDRGDPGQETSYGNAGVISPWSFVPQSLPGIWKQLPKLMFGTYRPLSVRLGYWPKMIPWGLRFLGNGRKAKVWETAEAMEFLCAPSVSLYRRHLQGTGSEHLVRDSLYVHAFRDGSKANLDAIDYRIRSEKGAELELVGSDELRRVEPALSRDFQAAVLIAGQARALSPGRIGAVLAEKAKALGVKVLRAEVRALKRHDDGWSIDCGAERQAAKRLVLAMGAWSADLLRPLGVTIPLATERGYHLEFPTAGIEINNSVTDTDAKTVASSMEGGVRVAGQAEFADVDAVPDPAKKTRLLSQALSAWPDLKTEDARFWMGRRPSFPDSLPMIGEFRELPGLYASFGHSHYGLMMAPKTGEVIADLLTGRRPNIDLAAVSTGRFSLAAPRPIEAQRRSAIA